MKALPVALHRGEDHEASHWLRTRLALIPRMWDQHGVLCCPHVVTRLPHDLVCWLALARPTGLTCSQCTHRLPLEPTCTRCHTETGELTGLALSWVIRGRPVQIVLGLCATCLDKELPA